MQRKSWDEYFLDIADEVSTRSTCNRLSVGCVIVKDKRIISTGYNGSIHGMGHCDDIGHLYNDQGRCIQTIHSEQNAILHANRLDLVGSTAYVTHYPCENCAKLLVQSGVKRVVYRNPYENKHSQFFLSNIETVHLGSKQKQNKLFIVSGHSGCGKSSIMRKTMKNELISVTTRQQRPVEIEGGDYYFKNVAQFINLDLAQHSYYGRHDYGVTKEEVETKLAKGDAYIVTSFDGMNQLRQYYPNSVTILFYSSYTDAEKNMLDRGETIEFINDRLLTYSEEVANKIHYDYVVKNIRGNFNETVDIVRKIIKSETK